ncbi:MAG: hypothetical protein RBR66_04475 [Candidatus Izemoplasmatales bacterium]|jgi:hypothetical protein|nr:hypothetical protein [Candidatus Izemoplasmatales bacterium]
MFLKILGLIMGLAFLLFGLRLAIKPRRFVKALMNYKYKTHVEPQKNAIVMTIILGVLLALAGAYYTLLMILLIIEG